MTVFREGYCGFFDHPSVEDRNGIVALQNADGQITLTDQTITTTRWLTADAGAFVDVEGMR